MNNQLRRFSMLPPGFAVAGNGSAGWAKQSTGSPVQPGASPLPSSVVALAQMYALAQQRAAATVQRRRWQSLIKTLLESQF